MNCASSSSNHTNVVGEGGCIQAPTKVAPDAASRKIEAIKKNEDRKARRAISNRESAKRSWERQKIHFSSLHETVFVLRMKNHSLKQEKGQLEQQLRDLKHQLKLFANKNTPPEEAQDSPGAPGVLMPQPLTGAAEAAPEGLLGNTRDFIPPPRLMALRPTVDGDMQLFSCMVQQQREQHMAQQHLLHDIQRQQQEQQHQQLLLVSSTGSLAPPDGSNVSRGIRWPVLGHAIHQQQLLGIHHQHALLYSNPASRLAFQQPSNQYQQHQSYSHHHQHPEQYQAFQSLQESSSVTRSPAEAATAPPPSPAAAAPGEQHHWLY